MGKAAVNKQSTDVNVSREAFLFFSLSLYQKMRTADRYTLSNTQRLFLRNHLPLFSAIANHLGYVGILRCTVSSDEHAANVATGHLVMLRLDEISPQQQQQRKRNLRLFGNHVKPKQRNLLEELIEEFEDDIAINSGKIVAIFTPKLILLCAL